MATNAPSAAGLARLHEAMSARVERGELPGLVTLIAHGDEVHVDTIGTMAFGSPEPMRRDTIFRIASMTKPIVAAAAMMLVEDGLLDLDEPVDRLLPELADRRVLTRVDGPLDDTVPARRPITLEDLLSFRMGFGHVTEPEFDPPYPILNAGKELQLVLGPPDPRTPHPPDVWIRLFATLPLMEQPGKRWRYNAGMLVLGVLVARAADSSLDEVLRARVFEPLGMRDTGFWLPTEQAHRIPSYYMTDFATGKLEMQPLSRPEEWTVPPVFPAASAGLLSTVDDYLAFGRLLLQGGVYGNQRLLTERSVSLLTTNRLTDEQLASAGVILGGRGWGLGMGVHTETGRYGWEGGYGTVWFNDPNSQRVAIGLTQVSDFMFNGGMAEFNDLAAQA